MHSCKVIIAKLECDALIAISEDEQATGLMYREPPLPAMVFPYANPKINKFWMKSTKGALDIIFCLNNKIISICKGEPHSTRIIGGDFLSDLIIELPAGSCEKYGIKAGEVIDVSYPKEALMKIFMLKNRLYS